MLRGLRAGGTNQQRMSPECRNEAPELPVVLVRGRIWAWIARGAESGLFHPRRILWVILAEHNGKSMDCGCLCNSWLCGWQSLPSGLPGLFAFVSTNLFWRLFSFLIFIFTFFQSPLAGLCPWSPHCWEHAGDKKVVNYVLHHLWLEFQCCRVSFKLSLEDWLCFISWMAWLAALWFFQIV